MKRFLILPLLLVMLAAAGAEEPVKLRYQFDQDQPLIYRSVVEETKTQTINNKEIPTTSRIADVTVRKLESVDDAGNFQMRSENKRLSVKINIAGAAEYVFDSTSEERDRGSALGAALSPIYDRLNGAFLDYSLSPQGKVLKVKNFKELLGDVIKDNPLASMMIGGGSNEMAQLGLSGLFVELSEKPVTPGDSWEVPFELKLPKMGLLKGKTNYTYEGMEKTDKGQVAQIRIDGELSFELNLEAPGDAKVTGNLSSNEFAGSARFDAKAGRLESMKTTVKLSGNMTYTGDGNTIAISLDQTTVTQVERLEKLPE